MTQVPSASPSGDRVLVVVSRYNEGITGRLLEGARDVLRDEGVDEATVDVVWVPGAFELPLAIHRGLATGRYRLSIALGAVIRGETSHFDYVCEAATRGLVDAVTRFLVPVGFGLLTCETMAQARARAGGEAGNKGEEAARAVFETHRALEDAGL